MNRREYFEGIVAVAGTAALLRFAFAHDGENEDSSHLFFVERTIERRMNMLNGTPFAMFFNASLRKGGNSDILCDTFTEEKAFGKGSAYIRGLLTMGKAIIGRILLTMIIVADAAVASDIKAVDVDSGAGTRALLVKADEARRPIDIPEDISDVAMSKDGSLWAVCDSRGELCRFAVDIDSEDGKIKKCSLLEIRHVTGGEDMEGLTYDPLRDSLWICDEKGPRIFEYQFREDRIGEKVDLPENLKKCIQNRSLEALEISPDGLTLLTCNEKAIPGDTIPGVVNAAPVRLTRFTRKSASDPWKFNSQRYYLPEPPKGNLRDPRYRNGVASICVDFKGRIFVLERESDKTNGLCFRLRVFEVVFPIETNLGSPDLMPVLEKRLVYEEDTGMSMYEGMCFGPVLKDGSQTLVLVSDGDRKASESIMTLVFVKPGFAKPSRALR